jgi:putative transposase
MSKPARNADAKEILSPTRTFFTTTKTSLGRRLLQSERHATLLIDVLRSYTLAKKFTIHDFVVMPDHLHLLMTLESTMSIEKAMQLIKGGYSYRLKKELGYAGEIWQRGFSEVRVDDRASFLAHRDYIDNNPVEAGLAPTAEEFPYCSAYLRKQKGAGAKAQ